jgi:hypothetical protein
LSKIIICAKLSHQSLESCRKAFAAFGVHSKDYLVSPAAFGGNSVFSHAPIRQVHSLCPNSIEGNLSVSTHLLVCID